jgi:hypothetical protein
LKHYFADCDELDTLLDAELESQQPENFQDKHFQRKMYMLDEENLLQSVKKMNLPPVEQTTMFLRYLLQ